MAEEENFPRGGKISRKRPPQENDNVINSYLLVNLLT